MNYIFTKRFVTKRVFKFSVLLTATMVIWHFTLLKSDAPYINSIAAWCTTLFSPFLACLGVHIMIEWYKAWFGSKAAGEVAQAGGGDLFLDISGSSIEAFLAILLLVGLLPVLLFWLPSEILIGIAYYKENVWQTLVSNITQYTVKEQFFAGVLGVLVLIAISTLIWEIIIVAGNIVVKSIKWALA